MFNRRRVNLLFFSLGSTLFGILLYQMGPLAIYADLSVLGWRLPIALSPYLLVYLLDTIGWRYTLEEAPPPAFSTLFSTRMAGEAINYLTPFAYLGGEPLKACLLRRHGIPLQEGLASVVVAKTVMTLAQFVFVSLGILLALGRAEGRALFLAGSMAVAALGMPLLLFLFVAQRWGFFASLLRLTRRLNPALLEGREEALRSLDRRLCRFYQQNHRAVGLAFLFFLGGWVAGSLEVYLLLSFLGLPIGLSASFAIEALSTLAKAATFFIPGSVGTQEGGNLLIFLGFALPMQAGMTFSLVRRARELLWAGLGLLALAYYGPPARQQKGLLW